MANRGQRNVKSTLNFFTKRPHLNPLQRRGSALFLKVLYFREDLGEATQSGYIKPIKIHYLGKGFYEVPHKFSFPVGASVNLGNRSQFRV